MPIRIGIDVGQHSVGFSAVEYDDDDWPIQILAAVTHIHDGGMDPDTAKTPQSRLATAGVARRTRRLTRNRRKRLQRLDALMRSHGYSVPDIEVPQTHDAWHARSVLTTQTIQDVDARNRLIVLAVRHIARHRGWRNPWWSYIRLAESESPTEQLTNTVRAAQEQFGEIVADVGTLGQLVGAVAAQGQPIRPTKKAAVNPLGALLIDQVRQEDSLAELRLILLTQGVAGGIADEICASVFFQNKPHIPKDRVGRCGLQPDQARAPLATLVFQEFRIRDVVGNLRIGSGKRRLTDDEHDQVVEFLKGWRDDSKPRWKDVAESLGISPRELTDNSLDAYGGGGAPCDRTSAAIEAKFRPSSKIGAWWAAANGVEHSELIEAICDLSGEDQEYSSVMVADLLADDEVLEDLNRLNNLLETGRAAYSTDTLRRLNAVMREKRCDLHMARKEAFNVDDSWQPQRPSFDDLIEHPTVARINVLVRRFLSVAVEKWGMPDRIVVEHVRNAFAGPAGLAEINNEIRSNTRRREVTASQLRTQGIENPKASDIRRNECVERQNCNCAYCGATITLLNCELDHIVPRAGGGGSRRDNLVAVCRTCNAGKGKLPFAVFAERSKNAAITVAEAQERVRNWQRLSPMTIKSFRKLQAETRSRLTLREDDEAFGDRSIESTAYAAREMRARIETFLDHAAARLDAKRGSVVVYSGMVTSEARKAGGVDDKIRLRTFTRKSRFDRRHHAIDASVLTTMNPDVAKTLRERANLHWDNNFTGKDPQWKEYRGSTEGSQASFGAWRERIQPLSDLLEQSIAEDRMPVVRPLRLAPRVGSVHADTIESMALKAITDAFSKEEILRIVNTHAFKRMSEIAGGEDLVVDANRHLLFPALIDGQVALYPSNSAYLVIRRGAAAIGGTVRYARVFAWRSRSGFDYGMVRMYAGEFPKIGFSGPGKDLFSAPLPMHSQAMRTANPTLKKRIAKGDARQIGWLAVDDEIELDPNAFMDMDTKIGEFVRAIPERHWTLTGFFDPAKISIVPSYLASEGVDEHTPEIVSEVLKANRIPMAVNVILGSPGCSIIRRSITGAPRWIDSGLPTSWNVLEATESVFGP